MILNLFWVDEIVEFIFWVSEWENFVVVSVFVSVGLLKLSSFYFVWKIDKVFFELLFIIY